VGIATAFDVQVAHSVEEVGQAAWDYLGDGQPFTSFRWYRFAEAALSSDQPIYVVLSRQGEPLASADRAERLAEIGGGD
jgi:predicted N-acyltransferase